MGSSFCQISKATGLSYGHFHRACGFWGYLALRIMLTCQSQLLLPLFLSPFPHGVLDMWSPRVTKFQANKRSGYGKRSWDFSLNLLFPPFLHLFTLILFLVSYFPLSPSPRILFILLRRRIITRSYHQRAYQQRSPWELVESIIHCPRTPLL